MALIAPLAGSSVMAALVEISRAAHLGTSASPRQKRAELPGPHCSGSAHCSVAGSVAHSIPSDVPMLRRHVWPGNVRALRLRHSSRG